MRAPKRVVWSEGMFMAPQHLQQMDVYHEALLEARIAAAPGPAWGVADVEIDAAALQLGDVAVNRFFGVLADGVVIAFDRGRGDAPPQRAIRGHFAPTSASLEVYVAVPREREGSPSYGVMGQEAGRRPRWIRSNQDVADACSGGSEVEVEFGAPNVEILFGDELRGDVEAIKVAEIVRNQGGVAVLAEDYVPPIFRVGASAWLMRELGKLLTLMVARQRHLAESGRQRDAANAEVLGADVSRFLLLSGLNAQIPVLRAVIESGDFAPFALYLELARFTGLLGTFSAEGMVSAVPRYERSDLRATFAGLLQLVTSQIGASSVESAIRIRLERRPDGAFAGRLRDERSLSARRFFLAASSELPEAQLAEQLPRRAKIAPASDIQKFVQAALPGIPFQVTHRPPVQIAVRAGVVYFAIDTNHALWRNVVHERGIAIYVPNSLANAGLALDIQVIPEAQG